VAAYGTVMNPGRKRHAVTLSQAGAQDADVVLAATPDADRVGVGVLIKADGCCWRPGATLLTYCGVPAPPRGQTIKISLMHRPVKNHRRGPVPSSEEPPDAHRLQVHRRPHATSEAENLHPRRRRGSYSFLIGIRAKDAGLRP
jgi:hypothetical protein